MRQLISLSCIASMIILGGCAAHHQTPGKHEEKKIVPRQPGEPRLLLRAEKSVARPNAGIPPMPELPDEALTKLFAKMSKPGHPYINHFVPAYPLPRAPYLWINHGLSQRLPTWEDLDDQVTIVIFTTLTCPLFQELLPEVKRLRESFGKVVIVPVCVPQHGSGVDSEDILAREKAALADILRHYDLPYPAIVDLNHTLKDAFLPGTYPSIFVIQHRRIIVPDCRPEYLELVIESRLY